MGLICASLDLFAAAVIGILLIGVLLNDEYPKPFGKKIILLLIGHLIGLLSDSIIWLCNPEFFPFMDISVAVIIQKTTLFLAYCMLASMTVIYTNCLVKYIKNKAKISIFIVPCVTVVCILSVIIWIISLSNDVFFTFDEFGVLYVTESYFTTQIPFILLLFLNLFLILKYFKAIGWHNTRPLLFYILLPIFGFLLSIWWDVIPVYLTATLSLILMFIVLQLEQDKTVCEQEHHLVQSRISLVLTQIQPQFLYNALTDICGLCDENPKEAKKVTAESRLSPV